jgi:hypothetical protein
MHKKWLHFLGERGISRPHAKLEIVVLIDLEDKYNLHFFQELKQTTILAPKSSIDLFIPLVVPSSLKPNHFKFEKKRQKINTTFCQAKFVLSPQLARLIFTPIKQSLYLGFGKNHNLGEDGRR